MKCWNKHVLNARDINGNMWIVVDEKRKDSLLLRTFYISNFTCTMRSGEGMSSSQRPWTSTREN